MVEGSFLKGPIDKCQPMEVGTPTPPPPGFKMEKQARHVCHVTYIKSSSEEGVLHLLICCKPPQYEGDQAYIPLKCPSCTSANIYPLQANKRQWGQREGDSLSTLLRPTRIACCRGYTSGHRTYSKNNFDLSDRLNELTCHRLVSEFVCDSFTLHECGFEPEKNNESSVRFTYPWVRPASARVACQKRGAVTGQED